MVEDLNDQATLQYGETFLYAGGSVVFKDSWSKIYKYDPNDEGWTDMPAKFSKGKRGAATIMIKREDLPSCD